MMFLVLDEIPTNSVNYLLEHTNEKYLKKQILELLQLICSAGYSDVYKKILSEKDIMKCVPRHSGGTNINCIYNWMSENKVKPNVMLILTDGYFGQLSTPKFNHNYAKKTILVLSSNIAVDDNIRKVGKIAKL